MPIHAYELSDATYAGSVDVGGGNWVRITHQQLSGNTEGKRVRLEHGLQDQLDSVRNESDLPIDDQERLDHVDNAELGLNIYTDLYNRPDGSLIDERQFYYQQNVNTIFIVHRGVLGQIILIEENVFGNGKHSWNLSFRTVK